MKKKIFCYFILLLFFGMALSGQEIKKSGSSMVLIPAGEFSMGKDLLEGPDYNPAHNVKINSFYMDKHTVTNGEYLRFCKETNHKLPEFWNTDIFKCGEKYLNYPVIGITWYDAKKYAEWEGKRLPTEAEWEYAARGGLANMDFPNGNELRREKKEQGNSGWKNLIDPVEKYEPNGFGLYDMSGNIWEWVNDYYSADYYKTGETSNPEGPEKGKRRVLRGGSWHSGSTCKKVYYRQGLPGHWCDFAVGFRCVKDIEPGTK